MKAITTKTADGHPWWKEAVVYQIYPASFKDSDGDGLGDIPGIISKLDYVKSLGTDVIWLSPMYDSPQYDLGYDIADYEGIYKPYGTMQDMQNFIDGCHERGMRIIIDLVINHTSSHHKWFQESKSSKTNDKRDWYIWRPAKYNAAGNRQPPNNWRSMFGGSAWEWDEKTHEYYLHLFVPEQPDLNWENPVTRKAIYASAITSWLKRGVDGFRIDAVNTYSKVPGLPDAPVVDPNQLHQMDPQLFLNGPRMHEFLSEMYDAMEPFDTMTVGELPLTPNDKVLKYVSAAAKQLDMVFQFDVVLIGFGKNMTYDVKPHDWKMSELKNAVARIQNLLKGSDAWITSFMENHDQARSISRFASDKPEYRVKSGKLLAMLNASLSGTLFIYEGQEIGMVNVSPDWPIEEYKDVASQNFYKEIAERSNNDPAVLKRVKAGLQYLARDNARVPMSWNSSPQGGFSTNPNTWMRTHDLVNEINVADEEKDENSVLVFWKKMIQLRRKNASLLVHGEFAIVGESNDDPLFVYTKENDGHLCIVVLNFSPDEVSWNMPDVLLAVPQNLLISTYGDAPSRSSNIRPYEGRIYECN